MVNIDLNFTLLPCICFKLSSPRDIKFDFITFICNYSSFSSALICSPRSLGRSIRATGCSQWLCCLGMNVKMSRMEEKVNNTDHKSTGMFLH